MAESGWICMGPAPEGLAPGSKLLPPPHRVIEFARMLTDLLNSGGDTVGEAEGRYFEAADGVLMMEMFAATTTGEPLSLVFPASECNWKHLH